MDMDRKIIAKIVKASGVSAGEMVLVHFWGEDADKQIANDFLAAVAGLGATPVLLQQSRSVNRELFLVVKESCFEQRYFELFSQFDAVLDVFAYRPVVLGYEIGEQQFALYRRYMAQLFGKLMECKRFAQIRIPTAANAEGSGLDPQEYIQRIESAYDIDYAAVAEACKREKERFAGVKKAVLRTGEGCALSFDLTGREWHIDAGDGDLPCNVYDIFKTILSVAGRVCGEDERARRAFFVQRAGQIPASWEASYKKAEQNGDAAKMHIETIKLDTIREIREKCVQIWGDAE